MNKYIKLLSVVIMAFVLGSCTKQTIGPLLDLRPNIPVTVANAVDYRPDPTVSTSKSAGGAIQIILSIPTGLGRTIKEITKVSASTSYTLVQGATGAYNSAAIPGSGTTATFNTTLAEYVTKAPGVIPAANSELAKRFFFIVTLDDNSTIVTMPTRVLVLN